MMPLRTSNRSRTGATLTEVLAALLVMAIGVVSVMTLFPIAILRSIQATQLTNATLLRLRADAQVESFGLVTDRFIPAPLEGQETHAVIDPLGWYDLASAGLSPGIADFYGNDGSVPYTQSRSPARFPPRRSRIFDRPSTIRRLGYVTGAVNPGPAVYPTAPVLFFAPPPAGRDAVLNAVAVPDTFDTLFQGLPITTTPFSVEFDASEDDLSHVANFGPASSGAHLLTPGSRAILVDRNGRRSQIRSVRRTAAGDELGLEIQQNGGVWTVSWPEALTATSTFAPPVSEVRIEVPVLRYSWMLTVRKKGISGGTSTEIDCVVFFNRVTGDPAEELVHTVTPSKPDWSGDRVITFADPANPPVIKGGTYIFDADHALWYRVQDVVAKKDTEALVTLDRAVEQLLAHVIIPRGVIHVFPLRTRIDKSHLGSSRRIN